MMTKRLWRQIRWCYREVYRPYGYGRIQAARCAVLLNVTPILIRWQERRPR